MRQVRDTRHIIYLPFVTFGKCQMELRDLGRSYYQCYRPISVFKMLFCNAVCHVLLFHVLMFLSLPVLVLKNLCAFPSPLAR